MSSYVRASDPYPLQSAKSTRLAPFYAALREGQLTTTSCLQCGQRHWPPRIVCPECLSDQLEWVALPKRAVIHAFTVQEKGVPPGFPRPLIFAVVALDGLRIFTRLVETDPVAVRCGQQVELLPCLVGPDPQDGEDRYVATFTVVKET